MLFDKPPDGQLLRKNQTLVAVLILLFLIRRSARARGTLLCHLSLINSPAGWISGAYLASALAVITLHPDSQLEPSRVRSSFLLSGFPTSQTD